MHATYPSFARLLQQTAACTALFITVALESAQDIEFRGYMSLGQQEHFHIVDKQTAGAFWLQRGATRGGLTVLNYNTTAKEVCLLTNGTKVWVKLSDDVSATTGTLHYTSLSPSNKQLLDTYKQFIRPLDNGNGTSSPDASFESKFERFIRQNPSRQELQQYLSQNSGKLDLKALANASFAPPQNNSGGHQAVMLGRKRGPTVGTTQWATKPERRDY
ncbi:hypothetical protein [Coraliomargarita akajimensis]|nr:hypothetical protein [Coraliomargarita akajimensis]